MQKFSEVGDELPWAGPIIRSDVMCENFYQVEKVQNHKYKSGIKLEKLSFGIRSRSPVHIVGEAFNFLQDRLENYFRLH